ncbi:MAG: hypothetical protein MI784_06565 [Cytophagales bacterium]|nr:hypothetical protein [Cytophagales bacterium]
MELIKEKKRTQLTVLGSLVIAFFLSYSYIGKSVSSGGSERLLHEGWQFRQVGKEKWHNANVPGEVQADLLRLGLLDDPFYKSNEERVQWVEEKDWEYRTTFSCSQEELQNQENFLSFDGLDTYADVYLNDSLILRADNMFVGWEVPVQDILKEGDNRLRIYFHSPVRRVLPQYEASPVEYPADNDAHEKKLSVFSRKAPYQFGWDWGTRLVTSGIYRSVKLKSWEKARIAEAQFVQKELNDDKASLELRLDLQAFDEQQVRVRISSETHAFPSQERRLALENGRHEERFLINIPNPKRWWPNGLGEAYMYPVQIELLADGRQLDSRQERIGLRTVEVVNKPDSLGESFYVKVNGKPVFMKGANYIPSDHMLTRVDSARYRHLLESAKEANMNMIRVWGGGIYEQDYFYELADELGLLVWQDFMFACTMYPGDTAFMRRVEQEAEYNIRRIRNHPSLALWCGNNEVQVGWENWGWQQGRGYSSEDSTRMYEDYKKLFTKMLPEKVQALDSGRFYFPSSPISNWGKKQDFAYGDNHYWGVWWGRRPFESFKEYIPRFMSEFGFQSFPEMSTIRKFSTKEDWSIDSKVMKTHQKSSIGNVTIQQYMDRWYRRPNSFEQFVYVSQVLQAEGMSMGLEAHRRAMPYCMGTLYWQLNDSWPVASWSGIDYYGNWKAMHYFVKKAFEPVLLSPTMDNGMLRLFVVNDLLETQDLTMKWELVSFDGKLLKKDEMALQAKPNSSKMYWEKPVKHLLNGEDSTSSFLRASLWKGNDRICERAFFFSKPKYLKLKKVPVDLKIDKLKNGGYQLRLRAESLVKNVFLRNESAAGKWSDNYFDLLPKQEKTVLFYPSKEQRDLSDAFFVHSLVDSYDSANHLEQ